MRNRSTTLFTFVAVLWLACPAWAQTPATKTWGVQGAVGIGYGTVPPSLDREIEATFNGGVFALLPFSERWSFQPELKFDRRKITTGGVSTDVTYLSVPILLRNDFLGVYMVQGISVNTLLSASVFDVDFKDAYTSPEVSIIVGLGKRFGRVSVDGRWETGLRDFQKDIELSGVRLRTLTANVSVYLK